MNTNALESKINSLQIIHNLAQSLGSSFFDYIEPVVQLLTSHLFGCTYSIAVRKLTVKILKHLLGATVDSNQMTALFVHFYPLFKAQIEK